MTEVTMLDELITDSTAYSVLDRARIASGVLATYVSRGEMKHVTVTPDLQRVVDAALVELNGVGNE